DTDAVLAGERSPGAHAGAQDIAARRQDTLYLLRVALVEEDARVQVAVAGVEDIGDAQVVPGGDIGDLAEDLRQAGARGDAVLGRAGGGEPPDGANALLARHPEPGPLLGVRGEGDAERAALPAHLGDALGLPV